VETWEKTTVAHFRHYFGILVNGQTKHETPVGTDGLQPGYEPDTFKI